MPHPYTFVSMFNGGASNFIILSFLRLVMTRKVKRNVELEKFTAKMISKTESSMQ